MSGRSYLLFVKALVIGFGLLILCLLLLFKISVLGVIRGVVRLEIIVAIAADIFFLAGLYFNYRSRSEKKPASPASSINESSFINYEEIKKSGLTQREHDVLQKMTEGLSNAEIAQQLFLSESTIKTHVSNILLKLDAKRRTQAVQIARELKIVK